MKATVTLAELEPQLLKRVDPRTSAPVYDIVGADGVRFICPVCFLNGGRIGAHQIMCWAPHVPQTLAPTPGRWHLRGEDLATLSLVGVKSSSVLLTGGCRAHFFVENGLVRLV